MRVIRNIRYKYACKTCEYVEDREIQEKAVSIRNKFKKWLDSKVEQVPPKRLLGKAISYTLNQLVQADQVYRRWRGSPDILKSMIWKNQTGDHLAF